MDAKKDTKIVECGFMAENQSERLIVGAKQIRKGLNANRISEVYLAQNADPAITEPIEARCQAHQIKYTWVQSMADLGRACGIEVGATMAAVIK